MLRKLAFVAICLASLAGTALAQDAPTVIANARQALGDAPMTRLNALENAESRSG